ncbi:hypothetical protein DFH07DRAFT_729357 [Mycena maculata]|uniref:Uncharacterized protein n=1 Tax=Mycena maculata TaxID=230809 RepID=A0AAD7NYY8_9AGAR|nr:hypothetical protein DFH07DRAFT_729357 [Mycena maculata]
MLCENQAIYGQPNTWYSLHPSVATSPKTYVNLTLEEKFTPYFAPEPQRSWLAFLGPLADQDPALSDAPKKSWEDVVRWIVQSGIRGFGSGLGALQFANNMVFAKIASVPSPAAMAQWIFANKNYGAMDGLRVLGFQLPKRNVSPSAVRAAFMCFYLWLNHHLSEEDKEVVHFDSIFVEQLLCKIGRWKHRMEKLASMDLVKDATRILDAEEWELQANLNDHTKFPFPSCKGFALSVFCRIVEEG